MTFIIDFFVFVHVNNCTCLHEVVGQPFKTILQWNLYFYRLFLSVFVNNFKSMSLFSWQSSNLEVRAMADLSL